jgi:hypothetical protein
MVYTNFPNGITSQGVPYPVGPSVFGRTWFVNTVTGSDGNDGQSTDSAFLTMDRAFDSVGDNDTIYFIGTVREQLVAPLGVTGVSIVGMAGGGVRDDDGAKWTYPASGATAGGALLLVRQQGWSVSNFLMTPEPTSGAAIELRRNEDATYPDASHFIATGMRFVGIDVTTTYGIRDIGGCSNVLVDNCEFYLLTTGYYCSSTAIAVPLRCKIINSRFLQNTNDIICPMSYCVVQNNRFFSSAATEKVEISGGGYNVVTANVFPDAAADIDPAHGYDGNATDIWTGNLVGDQAAFVYGDPA